MENPRRRGLPGGWGAGRRGAGRVFAGNLGGGAKYFFQGRNSHQGSLDLKDKTNHVGFVLMTVTP